MRIQLTSLLALWHIRKARLVNHKSKTTSFYQQQTTFRMMYQVLALSQALHRELYFYYSFPQQPQKDANYSLYKEINEGQQGQMAHQAYGRGNTQTEFL